MKRGSILLALLAVGFATASDLKLRSQFETWADETMTRVVTKSLLPVAKDEREVRDRLLMISASALGPGLFLAPDEIQFGKFLGFPAYFIRGVSLANSAKRRCGVTLVFTTEHTFTIYCFSPEGEPLPDVERHVRIEGRPSLVTEAVFSEAGRRVHEKLDEMRQEVLRLAEARGKKG